MKSKQPQLPDELKSFIDAGRTTFHCKDGDWDLRIVPGEASLFRHDLPPRSTMIAENGCGDCLFLRTPVGRKIEPKVFVFWHEEERHELFAKHVRDLTALQPRPEVDDRVPRAKPKITLSQLEAALRSPKSEKRDEALTKWSEADFGIEALPLLRRALQDDDPAVVIRAAFCIGKLGPEALSCPAGQAVANLDYVSLDGQLIHAGGKIWSYSGYANCYGACLEALVKLKVEPEYLIEYIHQHIGLVSPDDLLRSLNVLHAIGTRGALDLLKRAVAFWLPELNMTYAKKAKALVALR